MATSADSKTTYKPTRKPTGNRLTDRGITMPGTVFGISALGNLYQPVSHDTKRAIVAGCVEAHHGRPCFDGAGKYGAGLALESLGSCLRELHIAPADVTISNKLGWRRSPLLGSEPTFEPGVWKDLKHDAVQDISAAGIRACHDEGLALLAGYPVALASVHDPDEYLAAAPTSSQQRWQDIRSAYRTLIDLRTAGEVKAIGVGAKDWRVAMTIAETIDLDWVMFACSLTVHSHPPELLAAIARLHQRGIAVINSAVFHAGFLTGGSVYDYQPIDATHPRDQQRLAWRTAFQARCAQWALDPAAVCVQFGRSIPGVVATALNTSKPERSRTNADLSNQIIPAGFWQDLADHQLIDADLPQQLIGASVCA